MLEHQSPQPDSERPLRYDLSTIVGIPVSEIQIPDHVEQMAREYLDMLSKDKANEAQMADGGSDNLSAVKAANDALKGDDIPVDLFLIAPEGDEHLKIVAEAAYQSVTLVSNVGDLLAKRGLERLTHRIKEAYSV